MWEGGAQSRASGELHRARTGVPMSRQPVSMRQATIGDVPFLVELWSDVLRRADRQEQVHDLELIVKEAAASAEQRLLIAEYDGEPAGAVLLRVTPMTPAQPRADRAGARAARHPELPRQGHRQRPHGGRGALGRGPRHRPPHHCCAVVLAQRQPVHGPALAGAAGGAACVHDHHWSAPSWPRSSRPVPGSPSGWPAAATSARCWPRAVRSSSAPARTPARPDWLVSRRRHVFRRRHRLVGTVECQCAA